MAANYDQVALTWVKGEIDSTLELAKQSLESYFEDNSDSTQIRHCISCLHQVQGTLMMLEIIGGAMLAEEMEHLAKHISSAGSETNEEAFEALMSAILQLPRYLERLGSGHDDDPMVLLPVLNELRQQRNTTEILESQFFSVDLEVEHQATSTEHELPDNFDFSESVNTVRQNYQKALLNIMKSKDVSSSAEEIKQAFDQLEMYTAMDAMGKLWWVATGFMLAVTDADKLASKEVKSILGKLDRQIKALHKSGADLVAKEPDQGLISMMLYHVAHSELDHSRITELKSEFNLEQAHDRSNKVTRERIKLSGPDQDAMATVAGVMREDLTSIKEALDLYVRSKDKSASSIEELIPNLQQISDTLIMLELESVAKVVQEQISKIKQEIESNNDDLDAVVLDVAGTLLYIDASITSKTNFEAESTGGDFDDNAETMAADVAFQESRQIIIKECRVSLQHAKDSIIEYITNNWEHEYLEEVPTKLIEAAGATRMVDLDVPAGLLEQCSSYISSKVIAENRIPAQDVLDALADVLTSIDYYLEGLQSGVKSGLQSVLDAAIQSCEIITNELSQTEEPEPATDAVVQEPSQILKDTKVTDESLIDDDLIEIFLEEAEEVLDTLKEHLPRWIHDTEQYEDLTISRRSFHTLKGSGRMVGAQDIGELAWSIENLLNRIIEGSEKPSDAIFQVISFTQAILPSLIEDFRARRSPQIDLAAIRARADQLAAGEGTREQWTPPNEDGEVADAVDEVGATDAKLETEQTTDDSESSVDEVMGDLDAELLDIFATEANDHIASCEAFYNKYADSPINHKPDDSLLRALHTLKGSARMAGIFVVGDLITDVEGYFKELKLRNLNIPKAAFELLKSCNQFLAEYVVEIQANCSEPEEHEQREQVRKLAQEMVKQIPGQDLLSDAESIESEALDERSPESVQQLLLVSNDLLMNASERLQDADNSEQLKQQSDQLIDSFCRVTDLGENAREEIYRDSANDLVIFVKRMLQVELPEEAFEPVQKGLVAGIDNLLDMLDVIAADQSVQKNQDYQEHHEQLRDALESGDFSAFISEPEGFESEVEEVNEQETQETTEEKQPATPIHHDISARAGLGDFEDEADQAEVGQSEQQELDADELEEFAEVAESSEEIELDESASLDIELSEEISIDEDLEAELAADHDDSDSLSINLDDDSEQESEVEADSFIDIDLESEDDEELDQDTSIADISFYNDDEPVTEELEQGLPESDESMDLGEFNLDAFEEEESQEQLSQDTDEDFDVDLKPPPVILELEPIQAEDDEASESEEDDTDDTDETETAEVEESEVVADDAIELPDSDLELEPIEPEDDEESESEEDDTDDTDDTETAEVEESEEVADDAIELPDSDLELEPIEPEDDEASESEEDGTDDTDETETAEVEESEEVADDAIELPDSDLELEPIESVDDEASESEEDGTDDTDETETAEVEESEEVADDVIELPDSDLELEPIEPEDDEESESEEDDTDDTDETEAAEVEEPVEVADDAIELPDSDLELEPIEPEEDEESESEQDGAEPDEAETADIDETIELADDEIELPDSDLELEPMEHDQEESEAEEESEVDSEILEIALEESHEILERTQPLLEDWRNNPSNQDAVATLQRELHTLKGAARMGGVTVLGDFSHRLEDLYESLSEGRLEATKPLVEICIESQDMLLDMVEAAENNQQLPDPKQLLISIQTLVDPDSITEQAAQDAITDDQDLQQQTADDVAQEAEQASESEHDKIESDQEEDAVDAEAATETAIIIPIELDEDGLEILEIFLEEAQEIIDSLEETILGWQSDTNNKDHVALMQRNLHTLKGGARLSELNLLGDLSHHLETLYESVAEGRRDTTDKLFQLSFEARDVFSSLVKEINSDQKMTVPVTFIKQLEEEIDEQILASYLDTDSSDRADEQELEAEPVESDEQEVTEEDEQQAESEVKQQTEPEQMDSEEEELPKIPTITDLDLPPLDQSMPFVPVSHHEHFKTAKEPVKKPAKAKSAAEQVKVGADTLEDLVNLASESSILRSRLEQQVSTLSTNLEEMSSTIERLRTQLRAMEVETDAQIQYRQEVIGPDMDEFDPLEMDRYSRQQELARGLSESSNDLSNLKDNFEQLTLEAESLLIQQGQINTELQERLIDTRMVPFDSIVPRLQRMVRQISKELKKSTEITIRADGEMDRTVLEKMISPLEHMLRNAIDHGIEPPKERKKKGKKEAGKIKIRLAREGAQVKISISDDGAGINLDAVREKAISRGVITEDTVLSNKDLTNLIFSAGVSTAEEVTQISGRGVGMDVVFNEIKQLGGYVDVETEIDEGSTFIVRLPFTVSVNNALMVSVDEDSFAIPLTNIEGIVTVSPYELEELYKLDEPIYEYAGIQYDLYYLGTLLEHRVRPEFEGVIKPLPVMLLHGVERPVAVQLDGLIGSREVVVKSLGAQLSSIGGLSGATILGDGSVVLILDIPSLWRRIINSDDEQEIEQEQLTYDEDYVPTVMVVDDSITVRKVTSRLLERNQFEVLTAKDGVDASTQLQEVQPDIILLDIEMPKMDGFELATIVKSDPDLKHIPIIMITSRTGQKHKERALSIGVDDYMGKPFGEEMLLTSIEKLIGQRAGQ